MQLLRQRQPAVPLLSIETVHNEQSGSVRYDCSRQSRLQTPSVRFRWPCQCNSLRRPRGAALRPEGQGTSPCIQDAVLLKPAFKAETMLLHGDLTNVVDRRDRV